MEIINEYIVPKYVRNGPTGYTTLMKVVKTKAGHFFEEHHGNGMTYKLLPDFNLKEREDWYDEYIEELKTKQ